MKKNVGNNGQIWSTNKRNNATIRMETKTEKKCTLHLGSKLMIKLLAFIVIISTALDEEKIYALMFDIRHVDAWLHQKKSHKSFKNRNQPFLISE